MKDEQLKQLFKEVHDKIDAILSAIGQPQPTQQPEQPPQKIDVPVETTTTTPEPTTTSKPSTPSDPAISPGGFFNVNFESYPGHKNPVFRSIINGKPNPLRVSAVDPEIYITLEIFKDYTLGDKDTIHGNLIHVEQKDYTQEVDVENLKVQGIVLAGMTLAMRIRSVDEKDNIGEGEIVEFDVLQ